MRRLSKRSQLVLAWILPFALLGPSASFAESGISPPIWDQDRIVGAWVELWNSYDLDRVDDLFVIDERVTYLSSEREGTIVGIEAVREHHAGFGFISGGQERDTSLWVEDLHSTRIQDGVVVTAIWHFRRGDGTQQRGPMTLVYVLDDGEYRLIHLHFANYPSEDEE